MTRIKKFKEIKTIDTIYKYHSEFVDFTVYPNKRKIRINSGCYYIVISIEKFKEINKIITELGLIE